VSASAEGDRLVLRGPQGAITPALREALAQHKGELLRRLATGGAGVTAAIPRVPRDGPLPLSFAQQRLWFLDRLGTGTGYNVPSAMRLSGRLDVGALGKALDEIVRRHEALRTTFPEVDGSGVQRIEEARPLPLPLHDLRGRTDPGAEARRLAEEDAVERFDLARGPLLRAKLARIADAEHVLLLNVHHIVTDGWSGGVFGKELGALYEAFAAGRPSPLPELPVQYADFAQWQRQRLQGETLARELAWWKERLGGPRPRLELPAARPRPGEPGYRGAVHSLVFPRALSAGLRALARREGATLFSTLLAGFDALLRRYTGEDDVWVGVPTAGRARAEFEGLIGFFANTLVLRTDVSGDPSFRELVRRVKEVSGNAFEHEELPLERVVEELNPDRDLRGNPLFQVGFALQNAPREALELPELTIAPFATDVRVTRLDLEIHLYEHESDTAAVLVYSTELFDAETIERLGVHYVTLLEGALASPEARLGTLPLLSEGEARRVLRDWTATSTPYPRERSLADLFREQAGKRPGAVAVQYGDERLTYGELDERSNRLARVLSRRGVGPGVPVGLSIEPSVEMVVALVGIVKAGGAYVPLDPAFPAQRLRLMAEDSGLRLVLARASTLRTLDATGAPVLCLDRDRAEIEAQEPSPLACGAGPEDLAYVIYTSGSTGVPKGVGVPHRSVVRLVRDTDYVQLTETDVIAQASNATFDAATFEVWGALLSGARLEGLSREVTLSPAALAEALRERGVSVLFLTTALFDQVAKQAPRAFASLRVLLFGGEAADPRSVREVLRDGLPGELLHVYGPTENTTFSTWERVQAVDEDAATVPIGRPIANTRAYVLDERMKPAPIGIVGELYLGGDGLARGYLGRPDLTAGRFVPDPFGPEPGGRLYRTGDRVRWRASGSLEFVGRTDHQVKLRGFRVEPGEIEAVLAHHPAVDAVVVVMREDEPGDKRLVAYVAASAGALPETAELRAWARKPAPDYMVPSAFIAPRGAALSPNGKVDPPRSRRPTRASRCRAAARRPRNAIRATIIPRRAVCASTRWCRQLLRPGRALARPAPPAPAAAGSAARRRPEDRGPLPPPDDRQPGGPGRSL
jgi:amino acid adenylation domain-containing protein